MPKIKSYPIYKNFLNKNNSQIDKNTDEEPEFEENEEDAENKLTKIKSYKKIKGDYSIYWYPQEGQNTWRPDVREG